MFGSWRESAKSFRISPKQRRQIKPEILLGIPAPTSTLSPMNTANALIDPSILFFVLGIGAGLLRSNLVIPQQMARFLALYLLMAIGLKGGFALSKSGLDASIAVDIGLAVSLAVAIHHRLPIERKAEA